MIEIELILVFVGVCFTPQTMKQEKLKIAVLGLVALGIGQITAQTPELVEQGWQSHPLIIGQPPNDFDAISHMVRIERPPLTGVGTEEINAAKIFTQVPDDYPVTPFAGTTTWKTTGNIHGFGAATIYECPGAATPDSGECAPWQSPPNIGSCDQVWTHTFRRTFLVPCGGPYGVMILTYWRGPYVGFGDVVQFAELIDPSPSGDCARGYRSTITTSSSCPSPTPTPTPSATPTDTRSTAAAHTMP